jgi:hypothetical protein
MFAGGNISGRVLTSRNTTNATAALTGSIISSGGISALQDVYAVQTVKANNFWLHSQGHDLNFDEGTFTPFMRSDSPANDALMPAITYTAQQGFYQNCNQFTFIYIFVEYTIPASLPGVRAGIGGIPGTYFSNQQMMFSDRSVWFEQGTASENLQPYQLVNDPQYSSRWMINGFRQLNFPISTMINNTKVYEGTSVGSTQRIICNAVICRTTL